MTQHALDLSSCGQVEAFPAERILSQQEIDEFLMLLDAEDVGDTELLAA